MRSAALLLFVSMASWALVEAAVHRVGSAAEMQRAVSSSSPGDVVVATRSGAYGVIVVRNKRSIRFTSTSMSLVVRASFVLDNSHDITLERISLAGVSGQRQIVLAGPTCTGVTVRYCTLSSGRPSFSTPLPGASLWVRGIRILGSSAVIFGNDFLSLRIAITATGRDSLVQGNRIRFFSEDAIRVTDHGTRVLYNRIADAVATHGDGAHMDAIQLIPPRDRFRGGELRGVSIVGNQIRSSERLPPSRGGILQGIFASDGYFVDLEVRSNTVTVNSDHGISLNGARNLVLRGNRVFSLGPSRGSVPGIKLYYTRISAGGRQRWISSKPYSATLEGNVAPVLNLPAAYRASERGNRFASRTSSPSRGGTISLRAAQLAPAAGDAGTSRAVVVGASVGAVALCLALVAVVVAVVSRRRRAAPDSTPLLAQ